MLPTSYLRIITLALAGCLLHGAGCTNRKPPPATSKTYALMVQDALRCAPPDATRAAVAERLARDGWLPVSAGTQPDVRVTLQLVYTPVEKVPYDKLTLPTIPVDAGCALINGIYFVGWSAVQGGKAVVNMSRSEARVALRVVLQEADATPRMAQGEAALSSGKVPDCREYVPREAAAFVAEAFNKAKPVSAEEASVLQVVVHQQDATAPADPPRHNAVPPAQDATPTP